MLRTSMMPKGAGKGLALLTVAMAAFSSNFAFGQALSRIVAPVDESHLVTLTGNTPPFAKARNDQGPASVSGRMLITFKRSEQQEQALQQLMQDQQNPASPNYHKWLSPTAFGAQFGIADSDLQTVAGYLSEKGFAIGKLSKSRMSLEITGSSDQISDTFHTQIHRYSVGGKEYFANNKDPQIPEAIAPVVAGFASLSNFKPAVSQAETGSGTPPRATFDPETHTLKPLFTTTSGGATVYGVSPGDLAKIYTIPAQAAPTTAPSIGVISDSNVNLANLAAYNTVFSITANTPNVIVDGNDPGITTDALTTTEELELISAVSPLATVNLYTSATTDYDTGLDFASVRAVDDDAVNIVVFGFLNCESALGTAGNSFVGALWEQAAAEGITVISATGDAGAAACDTPGGNEGQEATTGGLAVNGWASTPYDTAVGGTDFYYTASTLPTKYWSATNTGFTSAKGAIPQQPWNDSDEALDQNQNAYGDPLYAGGGGSSTLGLDGTAGYAVPSWQTNALNGSASTRSIPDLSLFAGDGLNGSFYMLCFAAGDCANGVNSTFTEAGGTAGAASVFAGIVARIIQKDTAQGNINAGLYTLEAGTKNPFTDVTVGSNYVACASNCPNEQSITVNGTTQNYIGYAAKTGYDLASGLGTVNATTLINNWANINSETKPTVVLTVTAQAAIATIAGSGTTATVTCVSTCSVAAGQSVTITGSSNAGFNVTATVSTATTSSFTFVSVVKTTATTVATGGAVTAAISSSTSGAAVATITHGSTTFLAATVTGLLATPTGDVAVISTNTQAANTAIDRITLSSVTGFSASGNDQPYGIQLPGGSYNLTARYAGDTNFAPQTSSTVAVTVVAEPSQVEIMSASDAAITATNYVNNLDFSLINTPTVPYGSQVRITVEPFGLASSSYGIPSGYITVLDNGTAITKIPLNSEGAASFISSSLAAGSHSLTFSYAGDASFAASTSLLTSGNAPVYNPQIVANQTAIAFTVTQVATSTALSASSSDLTTSGGSSLLTAVVSASTGVGNTYPPTGSINFIFTDTNGNVSTTNVPVTAGYDSNGNVVSTATLTVNQVGTYQANFVGTGNYLNSTGTPSIAIQESFCDLVCFTTNTTTTITTADGGSTYSTSSNIVFNIQVQAQYYFFIFETGLYTDQVSGTVSIFANGVQVGQAVTLNPNTGAATFTVPKTGNYLSIPSGPVTFTAEYNGGTATAGGIGSFTADASAGTDNITITGNSQGGTSVPAASGDFALQTLQTTGQLPTTGSPLSVTYPLQLTATEGFATNYSTSSIALTCTAPAGLTCTLSASSVSLASGYASPTATIALTTGYTISSLAVPEQPHRWWMAAGGVAMGCVLLFGIPARRKGWQAMLSILFACFIAVGMSGCASNAMNAASSETAASNRAPVSPTSVLPGTGTGVGTSGGGTKVTAGTAGTAGVTPLASGTIAPGTYPVKVTGTVALQGGVTLTHNTAFNVVVP